MTIKKRIRKKYRQHHLGCPFTKSRSLWCYALCKPDKDGRGPCGRPAYFITKGRTDKAIREHKNKKDT